MSERKYIAISIKHTAYKWKYGMPCTLWGWKKTADDEKRLYGGYTMYLSKAELYDGQDIVERYGEKIVKPEPVPMTPDLCKRWKNFDTVLVLESDYLRYCYQNYIATEPPKGVE